MGGTPNGPPLKCGAVTPSTTALRAAVPLARFAGADHKRDHRLISHVVP